MNKKTFFLILSFCIGLIAKGIAAISDDSGDLSAMEETHHLAVEPYNLNIFDLAKIAFSSIIPEREITVFNEYFDRTWGPSSNFFKYFNGDPIAFFYAVLLLKIFTAKNSAIRLDFSLITTAMLIAQKLYNDKGAIWNMDFISTKVVDISIKDLNVNERLFLKAIQWQVPASQVTIDDKSVDIRDAFVQLFQTGEHCEALRRVLHDLDVG